MKRLWIEQASDIAKEYSPSRLHSIGVPRSAVHVHDGGGDRDQQVQPKAQTRSFGFISILCEGFHPWQARRLVDGAGVSDPQEQKQIARTIGQLYGAFVEFDAMLCEINPLIVTPDGIVKALDSKFTVDDNALYRHPDIAAMRDEDAANRSRHWREKNVTYVKLDGEVGVCGNGAGLTMSTVDVVTFAGGRPANFCDLGGGGDAAPRSLCRTETMLNTTRHTRELSSVGRSARRRRSEAEVAACRRRKRNASTPTCPT